jgi:NHLM bacteriocin system ABC transporter ATP-binding protein
MALIVRSSATESAIAASASGGIEGATVALAPGDAFPLDAPECAWYVLAGSVEVFVALAADGSPIDNRKFVQLVPTDGIVLGGAALRGLQVTALAHQGAALVPLSLEALCGAIVAGDLRLAAALEVWFHSLSAAAEPSSHPDGAKLLSDDPEDLEPGTVVRAAADLKWVRILRGSLRLYSMSEQTVGPSGIALLSEVGWAEAGDGGVTLHTQGIASALEGDLGGAHLLRLQRRLFSIVATNLLAGRAQEEERLQRSIRRTKAEFEHAAQRVAGLLNRRSATVQRVGRESPLSAVCRVVLQASGGSPPPTMPEPTVAPSSTIEAIARRAGVPVRDVSLQSGWWRQDLGPMVGFREDGRPVALLPDGRSRFRLYDPLQDAEILADAETTSDLLKTAFVLYPTLPNRSLRIRDLLVFSWGLARKELLLLVAAACLGASMSLAAPIALGILIDDIIPGHLRPQLVAMGGILIVLAGARLAFKLASDLSLLRLEGKIGSQLQAALMDRVIRLPSHFLDGFTSAALALRVQVIDLVRQSLTSFALDGILSGLFAIANFGLLLVYLPSAALVALAFSVAYIAVVVVTALRQQSALDIAFVKGVEAASLSAQVVENITPLRAGGAEERAFSSWVELYLERHRALLQGARPATFFAAFAASYEPVSLGALLFVMGHHISEGQLTGAVVAVISAYMTFVFSSARVADGVLRILGLLPQLRRAREILAARPEVEETRQEPGRLSGRVDVSHATFRYLPEGLPILDDVSISAESGQFIAIVGPSGCGKSTLMKLLLGFETPSVGGVYFDGQDLKNLNVRGVRQQVGVVLQDGRLLPGSIAENILGVSGGRIADAWEAARQAGLADEIKSMPMGMHTVLSDAAATLSGGQIQRMLIARALVGRPRVLLLDEATSALDNRTQALVTESFEKLAVTRIVIAHRLSTIEHADRIYVLQAGRVVQTGTFEELAETPGLFSDLVRQQME